MAIFLILLITTFFLPTFIKGKLPINSDYLLNFDPWRAEYKTSNSEINYVLSDSVDSRIPNRGFFNSSIKNHDFPVWNPNINLGTPYGFLLFTGTFSIANLTTIIAGVAWGTLLYYYLEIFIIGYFIYIFLRQKNMSVFSSVLGMVVASFSSYIIVYLGTYVIDSVIYIPVILYFGERYINSSQHRHFVGLSITVFLSLLSGFPAITMFSILITAGYFTFIILFDNNGRFGEKAIKLIHIAAGFITGFLLSLISLIPTYEFFKTIDLGYRISRSSQRLSNEFIWRIFNGNICGNPVEGNYFCKSNYNETALYVGLSPILLFPFSIARKKYSKLAIFFITSSFFIFITVFGIGNFHKFIGNLPLFNLSSNTRMIALFPITMAIISSIGLENILEAKKKKKYYFLVIFYVFGISYLILLFRKRNPFYDLNPEFITDQLIYTSLFSISIGLVIVAILKFNNENFKKLFALILILFSFLDSGTKLYNYNGASNINTFFPDTPGINYLTDNQEPYERMIPVSRRVMVPGFPLYYSINSLLGRWWTSPDFREVISLIDPGVFDSFVTTQPILDLTSLNFSSEIIDLLRIKYIILPSSDLYTLEKITLSQQAEYNNYELFTFPNEYSQTIKAESDQKINKLSLKITSSTTNTKIPIEFRLYIGGIKTIDKISDLVKINDQNYFELNFDVQNIKKHQEIRFEVVPLESSENYRIYYVDFDIYKNGEMQINKNPWNADFAFELFYFGKNLREDYSLVFNNGIKIYRNNDYTDSIPVIFSTVLVGEENCISTLSNINPEKEALVFTQILSNDNDTEEQEKNGYAKIIKYSNNHLVIFADLSHKGMIILSDQWYPGWTAKVDGKDQDIEKVNCIMRGVVVEEGNHIIEMHYQPKSIKYGSLISGVSLLILLIYPLFGKIIYQFRNERGDLFSH